MKRRLLRSSLGARADYVWIGLNKADFSTARFREVIVMKNVAILISIDFGYGAIGVDLVCALKRAHVLHRLALGCRCPDTV